MPPDHQHAQVQARMGLPKRVRPTKRLRQPRQAILNNPANRFRDPRDLHSGIAEQPIGINPESAITIIPES
jgi:hypothetical protein